MPSGPKKRRAQKKKKEAAAKREKTENEAPPSAISEENSHVMQTESTDGVTAVLDEPSVVLPKRTVLPEKMLASQVFDLKWKDTEEGIKENALPPESYSSVQSLNVAVPFETSRADKIDVVVESSVVAEPCVIELDSQDKDDGSIMSTDVCDSEGKEAKADATEDQDDDGGSIMASDDAAFFEMDNAGKSLTTEPCDLDLNAAESSNAENGVFTNVDATVDQRALEHKKDNAVETKQDLGTPKNRVASENQETAALYEDTPGKSEKAFQVVEVEAAVQNKKDVISKDVNEIEKNTLEAVAENQGNAAPSEVDAPEKTEEAVQVEEVEAAPKNQEDEISEDVNEIEKNTLEAAADNQVNDVNGIEKNTLEAAAEENQGNASPNEVDAQEKTEEAVQVVAMEAAPKYQEISKDFYEIEKNTLEAAVEDQITAAHEVDAPEKTGEVVPVDEVEAVISAKPAVDAIYQTHDAISAELVTPEVGKQLKELKEIVEDILNRLNAIGALLHRN